MRDDLATRSPLRSAAVALLTAGFLAVGSLAAAVSSASAAPAPGDVSLSDIQVTPTGVTAILTARAVGGAKIDPGSVKATIGGVDTAVSVRPIVKERRVTTLLIDTSGSMGAAGMATAVRAADAFLAAAPADVYVGVVAFSTVPKVIADPTLDRAVVRAAIAGLKSQGETSLFDGIAVALSQLGTTGDRSLVLLSDGGDTRSRRTLDQTVAALSAFGVRAQVVGFKTSESQGSVLARLASVGHGSVAAAGNDAAVSAAFKMAAQDLVSQVRVVITAPPSLGGLQSLKVTATAAGTALASVTSVNLAVVSPPSASPAPTAAPTPVPVEVSAQATAKGPLGIAWMLWFALLAIFVGVGAVILVLGTPAAGARRQRRLESIERYIPGTTSIRAEQRSTPTLTSISDTLVNLGDKVMDKRASTPRTQQLLERADLPLRPGEWAVLRVVSVVVGVAGGMVLMRGGSTSMLVGAVLGVVLGLVMPSLFLKLAAKRRAGKFENQLPDVLTLIASSLSTGFSLLQALDAVARDASEPSAKEFSRALAETRIGADIEDSLDHLADRMDSTNMRWTGMAISIQRQVGGNLAETMRNTAATLRDREALKRHVKGLSAEGRLSAYILIALPIGIFLFMLVANKPYVELLWTNAIGIGMLGGALISMAIGVFWMRKVVDVEV